MFLFIKQSLTQFRFLTVSARPSVPGYSFRKSWSNEEDLMLREARVKYGRSWRVIALSFPGRTPSACSSRFARLTNDPKPIHDRSLAWTEEETNLLREKVAEYGSRWKFLASSHFPNRAPTQLANHWTVKGNPRRRLGTWLPEEETRLFDAIQNDKLTSQAVAQRVGTRNSWQCWYKYHNITQSKKKGPFTHEEDKAILDAFKLHPRAWRFIASEVSKVTGVKRVPGQCRYRYERDLDPRVVKVPWTAEEDKILVDAYNHHGSRLSTIPQFLPNYRGWLRIQERIRILKGRGVIESLNSEDES
ncbi:Homeodomain-like protein [Jimgerdemannia flammicorona]|uniref:Homeodomain-like protein n=1 Tax=Jimgerdemannia flammicorona TaxID=994334 RepID=A0A433DF51_9FUNG|nr:Homeodomain-like protein [Jimgerdemannia flammicorona]